MVQNNVKTPTGGAETKLGLLLLTNSPYVSPKSAIVCASGGCTNPSLMWMLPEAFVLARVEVRGTEKGCVMRGEGGMEGWLVGGETGRYAWKGRIRAILMKHGRRDKDRQLQSHMKLNPQ